MESKSCSIMAYKCQGYSLSLPVLVRKAHRKEQTEQARHALSELVPTALQIWLKVSLQLGGVSPCLQSTEWQIPYLTASLGSCQRKPSSRQPAALPLLSDFKAQKMGLSKETHC